MKHRMVIFCILIVSLLASASTGFAAPPQPIKVNVVLDPATVHLGDAVNFRCLAMSLGNTYPLIQVSASYPGKVISVKIIHAASSQGPHILIISFVAERSGTITCQANASVDGVTVTVQDAAELVVVP